MKRCLAVDIVLCLLIHSSAAMVKGVIHRVGAQFGPKSCVALTRSPDGTCVITTSCAGLDTSQTEFAFDCVGKNIVRHSFGVGGFDAEEEFDSELKCDQCTVASQVDTISSPELAAAPLPKAAQPLKLAGAVSDKKHAKLNAKVAEQPKKSEGIARSDMKPLKLNATMKYVSHAKQPEKSKGQGATPVAQANTSFGIWGASSGEQQTKTRKMLRTSPDAVKYGPNGCVSTYKNTENHCIMSTNCRNMNMTDYEYGLVCVDKVGSPVKHIFGKDSFDPVETFDTLIKCNECLGLEDVPDAVVLAGEVSTLAKVISGLQASMTNVSMNLERLNKAVFPPMVMAAPAPAPALPPASFTPTRLLHKSASHHKHAKKPHSKKKKHLRHSHFRHHQQHVQRRSQEQDDEEELDAEAENGE